ncbi:hypothetical protein BGW36DRAFT_132126 [Talaromyces proteolyticus]|uniref:TPR-like protein n=1 Tax=Talaromyces proteolyticus TaxID=1131652 RepID=A0AAD4KTG7_9EURO|nr:uncharacterized protein BGW36DRAFT_132126 [Talaromyces proteolyticus]KAH8700588.1 hypothetical protein BGW36DRAFT_132126 [Talaromyces proteolyticus]
MDGVQYAWPAKAGQNQPPIHPAIDPRLYDDAFVQRSQDPTSSSTQNFPTGQQNILQNQFDANESSSAEDEIWDDEMDYGYDDNDDEDADYEAASAESEQGQDEEDDLEPDSDSMQASSSPPRKRPRRGRGPFSGRYGARGGKGIKRGPRRPLEPSPEFKMLHSQATEAFIDGDYDRAIELVQRAILVNPEMFAAHSLLSEIFLARGEDDKAISALFSGAHTKPRDPTVWYKVSKLIQERSGEDRQKALNDMVYCFSRIIEIDPKSYNARFQRAAAYRELGSNGRAATEYERILKEIPHNIRALRHLAETYIDMQEVQKAIRYYTNSIEYYMSHETDESLEFSWSDVNICVELYAYIGQYESGLQLLKSVSRWLVGRKDDKIWDSEDDDREWDAADSPRRIKTNGFIPGVFPIQSYGLGLPMELRIKLGIYRLKLGERYYNEALTHFEWLTPDDKSEGSQLYDYGDLFREAADALKDAGLFEQALRYYEPLQYTEEYADVSYFLAMGDCAFASGRTKEAEACYLTVVENDSTNLQSRVNLAKLYEELGMKEQALYFVNQAVLLGRGEAGGYRRTRRRDRRLAQLAKEFQGTKDPSARKAVPNLSNALSRREAIPEIDADRPGHVRYLYSKMNELRPAMRQGDVNSTEDWLDIADVLLREFRSNRVFYPLQKNMTFLGYSRDAQGGKKKDTVMDEVQELAGRLQESLGNVSAEQVQDTIPNDYFGISFDEWLDIFLEYAFMISGQGDGDEVYNTLAAAADASVWYHSKEKTRQIHVCWFTCALRLQDEETLVTEARWFSKEYQFVTDTYRLYSILSRLCGDPRKSLFHASPNMKFMLRQVKAMDLTIPDSVMRLAQAQTRDTAYQDKPSLTSRNENGELITADELDVAMLVLYGHILYSGNSFYPALNYYLRAYAIDKDNPSVLLSIGLCYIHHSLKRQAENRHFMILQGLSFMSLYRKAREKKGSLLVERQEVEVNFARVYHSLGLLHQAVAGYERALEIGDQIHAQKMSEPGESIENDGQAAYVEDFSSEAAVALQNIYATSGDTTSARQITERYLVI